MSPGRPILTAERMRAAEQRAIAAGSSVEQLMERAGAALAEAAYRFGGPQPTLILAGPGNNGGDGYVAARHLAARGVEVRVAALADPTSEAAMRARSLWDGAVESLAANSGPAPIVVDCLFGTGLKRGLEDHISKQLIELCSAAMARIAGDLPSGIESDTGAELSPVPDFDMTVAFGALKPAHLLHPTIHRCGRLVLADIGIEAASEWSEIGPPELPPLDPSGDKYDRGFVHCIAGAMPGAIALAATAAARGGAGYVRIQSDTRISGIPAGIVQGQDGRADDQRIGAVLIGPGLGRDREGLLDDALKCGRPLVIDGDAIGLLGEPTRLQGLDAIVTPHDREFHRLFGQLSGAKPERALEAARRSGAVVVCKGPDTLVAAPDGRLGFRPPAPAWLASAGTGDVLAGLVAAMRARGLAPFEAACAAVWLHARAAQIAGPQMIADDLAAAVPSALALIE